MPTATKPRPTSIEADLIASLDGAPGKGRHQYTQRPPAKDLTPEIRTAIRKCDLLADRLAESRIELAAHVTDSNRAAAIDKDGQAVADAVLAGAKVQTGKHLAAWEMRSKDLQAEQTALEGALAKAEDEAMWTISGQYEITGEVRDLLQARGAAAIAEFSAALDTIERVDRQISEVRALALWFVKAGIRNHSMGHAPFEMGSALELRRGEHYSEEVVQQANNQTTAVLPSVGSILTALREYVAPFAQVTGKASR